MALQFVFDYRSPYAYLANTRVADLDVGIDYRPVDVLMVMRQVNNQPSPECPAKARYARLDAGRWAGLYGVPLAPNAALLQAMARKDFDGTWLSRAGLAAIELGVFDMAHPALFEAAWASSGDLLSAEGRAAFLRQRGIDADIWHRAGATDIHDRLAQLSSDAADRGVFGVPAFFVGTELFFGNDRLDFVRTALQSSAI
ncbi:2-hydroxychromene-2-carboxylate isomerase [Cupriavidus oxalaticus]|uniref:2-hydroxychromene-2-carboxylate isomerase n=1 Tax=Cupriavidus oxalaticus TaxID=96344 RepID=UPI0031703586